MVITGGDIGHQGTEHVKWRFVAQFPLFFHVHLNLVEGHMAGTLDHHLYIPFPGFFGQFTQHPQFRELCRVRGIMETTGAQTITQGEGDVIFGANIEQGVKVGVEGIFLFVVEHPLSHQGPTPGDDFGEA